MQSVVAWICMLAGTAQAATATETLVQVVDRPAMEARNDHYISNRPPLVAGPLVKLPAGAIRPQGWLRKQLKLQAEGFHGHLGEISRFLEKEGNAWLGAASTAGRRRRIN